MSDDPTQDVDALLLEVARLYGALIRVVREIDDPQLKAEIAELIWPRDVPAKDC